MSPSSLKIDLVEKLAEYTGVPSVQAYLVLSQDEPRAWLWTRGDEEWSDQTIDSPDETVAIQALGVEFPLRALYPQSQT